MTNHSIDIYFFTASPPARSTLMLVRALGIKHNIKIVNIPAGEQFNEEFVKLNPLHTIPVINDNGFIVRDSNAIMKYLVDQYAKDDSLCPRDAKQCAIVNEMVFFNATCLFPRMVDFFVPVVLHDQPQDPEKKVKLEEALSLLNQFLEGQQFAAGKNLTIADFALVGVVGTIDACDVMNLSNYRNLWQWYQRTKAALAGFGYEEVNQAGADIFGNLFKSKVK